MTLKLKSKMLMLTVLTGMIVGLGAIISERTSAVTMAAEVRDPMAPVAFFTCNVPSGSYPNIQSAVNDPSCNTIDVATGTYNENVTITRSLALNGARVGVDARTRSGSESSINGGTGPAVTISADNVTVDGFTLNGPASSGTADIVMQTANTGETIQNNIFNNPGRAASITTSNTIFSKNRVNNTSTSTDGFQANSSPVQNLTFSDNSFSSPVGPMYAADITVIEGNSNIVVSGNSSNGDGTLIALFKTNGAQITDNTVVGDGASSAIYIGGGDSNVAVSGNQVSAAGAAVKVANAFGDGPNSTVTVTDNTLSNNSYGLNVGPTAVNAAETVQAHNNNITGNSVFGANNDSGETASATCNWWGAANGPGPVGTGSGDKISANVDYTPWLLSSAPFGACGGGTTTKKDCDKAVDQKKKDFDDQQQADDKAFDDKQKADKKAFDATHPSPQDRKTFDDQQKADKKAFDDQQKADKKAFDDQNKADKEQCESLPK